MSDPHEVTPEAALTAAIMVRCRDYTAFACEIARNVIGDLAAVGLAVVPVDVLEQAAKALGLAEGRSRNAERRGIFHDARTGLRNAMDAPARQGHGGEG